MNRAELAWGTGTPVPPGVDPTTFSAYLKVKVRLLDADEDLFGDGTVVILQTPGHTPGHQSLAVRLAHAGTVVLSGDLCHTRANWEKHRVPPMNSSHERTLRSIERVEALLAREHGRFIVQHALEDVTSPPALPRLPRIATSVAAAAAVIPTEPEHSSHLRADGLTTPGRARERRRDAKGADCVFASSRFLSAGLLPRQPPNRSRAPDAHLPTIVHRSPTLGAAANAAIRSPMRLASMLSWKWTGRRIERSGPSTTALSTRVSIRALLRKPPSDGGALPQGATAPQREDGGPRVDPDSAVAQLEQRALDGGADRGSSSWMGCMTSCAARVPASCSLQKVVAAASMATGSSEPIETVASTGPAPWVVEKMGSPLPASTSGRRVHGSTSGPPIPTRTASSRPSVSSTKRAAPPGRYARRGGMAAKACWSRSRKSSRCGQPAGRTTTRGAAGSRPALWASWRREAARHEGELVLRVEAGDHDHRTDVAGGVTEVRGDLGARPQVGALLLADGGDAEEATLDQRREGPGDERLDGGGLARQPEQDHVALDEEREERVEQARGRVGGAAEDEGDAALGIGRAVERGLPGDDVLGLGAGGEEHHGLAVPRRRALGPGAGREAGHHPAVGALLEVAGGERGATGGGDVLERLGEQAGVGDHGNGPGDPGLGGGGAGRIEAGARRRSGRSAPAPSPGGAARARGGGRPSRAAACARRCGPDRRARRGCDRAPGAKARAASRREARRGRRGGAGRRSGVRRRGGGVDSGRGGGLTGERGEIHRRAA